jgi:glycogen(starch) synthase
LPAFQAKPLPILEEVRAFAPEIRERSSVVYNGLEAATIQPKPPAFDPPSVLCLGRLVPQKGLDLALQAFAQVVEHFPKVKLVIAGEGIERPALEEQAVGLHLQENVEFRGMVVPEKVPELLNEATLLLMASRMEGFPMAALEAMQMGRPIVATAVGGVPEAVLHGISGWIAPPQDIQALAEGMRFLLEHPDKAVEMGEAGRRRQQELFSLENTVREYDALYRNLAPDTD